MKPIYISLYVNMLLETVVIFVYCGVGINRYQSNMESEMILNIRTKEDYEIYIESLERYILSFESSNYYGFPESKFKDALNNPVVFVSNATDGAEYGIVAGQFYSYKTILFVNNKLKKQSKDLPIWHTSLDDLRYFKSQVSSKDFRFINDIDNLPESVIYRKEGEKATVTLDPVTG